MGELVGFSGTPYAASTFIHAATTRTVKASTVPEFARSVNASSLIATDSLTALPALSVATHVTVCPAVLVVIVVVSHPF